MSDTNALGYGAWEDPAGPDARTEDQAVRDAWAREDADEVWQMEQDRMAERI